MDRTNFVKTLGVIVLVASSLDKLGVQEKYEDDRPGNRK